MRTREDDEEEEEKILILALQISLTCKKNSEWQAPRWSRQNSVLSNGGNAPFLTWTKKNVSMNELLEFEKVHSRKLQRQRSNEQITTRNPRGSKVVQECSFPRRFYGEEHVDCAPENIVKGSNPKMLSSSIAIKQTRVPPTQIHWWNSSIFRPSWESNCFLPFFDYKLLVLPKTTTTSEQRISPSVEEGIIVN